MGLRSCLTRLRRWFRRPAPAAPRRRLLLEQLEARDVPAVLSGDAYLATLYQGFLGRSIDTNGLIFWRQALATTGSRTTVAADILNSPEYRGRELQLVYPALLGRPLDPAGLAFWGNVLERGGTYEQVKAGIFGSQEFFDRSGDTLPGFITDVFRSQIGRNPTVNDISFWESRFGRGSTRQALAAQILGSDEAHQVELAGVYREILSRPLDPAGASFWGGVLRGGASVNTVLAGVAGSDEYFRQLTTFLALNNPNEVKGAATGFLNAGAKFTAQLPGVEQLDRLIPTDSTIRTTPINASLISVGVPSTAGPVAVGPGATTPVGSVAVGPSATTPVGSVSVGPSATTPVGSVSVGPSATTPTATLSSFGVNPANSFITGGGSFTTTGPASVTTTGPGAIITTGPGSFTTTGFGAVPTNGMQSFITSGPGAFTSTTGPTFL